MKKLFFTAIAIIAFSGVSIANTVESELITPPNGYSNCVSHMELVYDAHMEQSGATEENYALYQGLMNLCAYIYLPTAP